MEYNLEIEKILEILYTSRCLYLFFRLMMTLKGYLLSAFDANVVRAHAHCACQGGRSGC